MGSLPGLHTVVQGKYFRISLYYFSFLDRREDSGTQDTINRRSFIVLPH